MDGDDGANEMKRSIDDSVDDHPEGDDERPPANWTVGMADDCEACDDLRVVLTLEEKGSAGLGIASRWVWWRLPELLDAISPKQAA